MGTSLAGCTGSEEDPNGGTEEIDTGSPDGTETVAETETATETATETETQTETQTQTETATASIETISDELVVDEGEFFTEVYVAATVENVGDAPSGMIELNVEWYDEDGNYMSNDSAYMQSLGAGETWAAHVDYAGSNVEGVDDYEIGGDYDRRFTRATPDGLTLLDSEMLVGEDVVIKGEVENGTGEDQSYVEAIVDIYNDDGVIMDEVWTNVTDLPDGETWSFDVTWFGSRRIEEAADHEVLLTTEG